MKNIGFDFGVDLGLFLTGARVPNDIGSRMDLVPKNDSDRTQAERSTGFREVIYLPCAHPGGWTCNPCVKSVEVEYTDCDLPAKVRITYEVSTYGTGFVAYKLYLYGGGDGWTIADSHRGIAGRTRFGKWTETVEITGVKPGRYRIQGAVAYQLNIRPNPGGETGGPNNACWWELVIPSCEELRQKSCATLKCAISGIQIPTDCGYALKITDCQGGTPPYRYFWSDGYEGDRRRSPPPGDYVIVAVDANGCTSRGHWVVPGDRNPPTIELSASTECDGKCEVTAYVRGGRPPFTFDWGSRGRNVTNAPSDTQSGFDCSQTVRVTVTDGAGCTIDAAHTLKQIRPDGQVMAIGNKALPPLIVQRRRIGLTCQYWVTIQSPGGQPPFQLELFRTSTPGAPRELVTINAGNSATIAATGPGTFRIDLTNARGCKVSTAFRLDCIDVKDGDIDEKVDLSPPIDEVTRTPIRLVRESRQVIESPVGILPYVT